MKTKDMPECMHDKMDVVSTPVIPFAKLALLTGDAVERLTGLKKSARHKRGHDGTFPQPFRLSSRCSRYRAGDIEEWLRDPHGWSPEKAIDGRAAGAPVDA